MVFRTFQKDLFENFKIKKKSHTHTHTQISRQQIPVIEGAAVGIEVVGCIVGTNVGAEVM